VADELIILPNHSPIFIDVIETQVLDFRNPIVA